MSPINPIASVVNSSWSPSDLLFAAVIAGVVALIGHFVARTNTTMQVKLARTTADQTNRIARENNQTTARLAANTKLAEMRQAWISGLRSEMTNFQSLCASLNIEGPVEFAKIYKAGTTIELHMNPEDPDYLELKQAMNDFVDPRHMALDAKRRVNDRYVAVCHRILKREWDKLQSKVRSVAE